MRKFTIFVMLGLLLCSTVSAQGTETSVFDIVNNMLSAQGLGTITEAQFNDSLVSYQTYAPGDYTLTYYGKQAANNQHAYAYQVSSPGTNLFDLGSYPDNSTGTKLDTPVTFSPTVVWGLKGDTIDGIFYSQDALNSDGQAHWHLYCLKGLGEGYDLSFAAYEDRPKYNSQGNLYSDFDYNDLVLKIEPNPPGAVPLPGAVLLLGVGLGRMAIYRRRKMNTKK
jgi:hypothetical protein